MDYSIISMIMKLSESNDKAKRNANEEVDRYKARFIPKDYKQKHVVL